MGILEGKLLFPLRARIARLDAESTFNADGFDPFMKQPKFAYTNAGTSAQQRVVATQYMAPILILAQIERGRWMPLAMGPGGDVPDAMLTLIMHARHLKAMGLIDPSNGEIRLKKGDKLLGLFEKKQVPQPIPAQTISDIPGMYVEEIEARGEGLAGKRNLFKLTFNGKPQGIVR